MKTFFKILLRIFFILIGIIGIYVGFNYYSDITVEELKEKYAYENSQFIECNNAIIHYRINGEGHPFVLIHGFGANLWNWEEWTELLEEDYKIIALDLPGFGLTGPNESLDYSTESQVETLNQFLELIGIDTFYLAGNSMGGNISWNYTLKYPEKVKKLILLNSSGYPSDKEMITSFKILQTPVIKDLVTKISPKSLILKTLQDVYEDDNLATEEQCQFYHDIMRRPGNRHALVSRMGIKHIDNSKFIPTIQTPTLILWGDKDLLIPVGMAHQFHNDLPNSEIIVYENIGHVPMVEIPAQTADDVIAFLNDK